MTIFRNEPNLVVICFDLCSFRSVELENQDFIQMRILFIHNLICYGNKPQPFRIGGECRGRHRGVEAGLHRGASPQEPIICQFLGHIIYNGV